MILICFMILLFCYLTTISLSFSVFSFLRLLASRSFAGEQPQDPFAAFFGGGRQQQGGKRRSSKKGKDFHMEMEVDLEDMYNGGERSAQITRRVICKHCGKTGKKRHMEKCKSCTARCPNEVKMVNRQMAPGFVIQQQEEVPSTEKCKNEPKNESAQKWPAWRAKCYHIPWHVF